MDEVTSAALRRYVVEMNATMKQLKQARIERRAEISRRYRFRRMLTRLVPYHCSCCLEQTAVMALMFGTKGARPSIKMVRESKP